MTSYRDAGVDVAGGEEHVSRIARHVTDTWSDNVIGQFGGFAAGVEMPPGYTKPVLMMTTDGVGTKLEIARRSGLWDGVGQDLVAMCVDDLVVAGAMPLGFVDYMAVGELRPDRDTRIVQSVAAGCSIAGCALLGGETAEHPGVMEVDAVDLAGSAVGVVESGAELDAENVALDDVIVGLRSPNLRSNGFSLVRRVMGLDIDVHAEVLLEPSVIYTPAVLRAIETGGVRAAAHVTGGGLASNLERSLPKGMGADVDRSSWDAPEVFEMIAERGVNQDDMYSTFNMGIGFCLIVDPDETNAILRAVDTHDPCVIGHVVPGESVTLL